MITFRMFLYIWGISFLSYFGAFAKPDSSKVDYFQMHVKSMHARQTHYFKKNKESSLMVIIARNQLNKKIREILPEKFAAKFVNNSQYLMFISIDQESDIVTERLNEAFDNNASLIKNMVDIYGQLANTAAIFNERVNANKRVSGEKTLLVHLTDGMSHLKIYPNVNFN